MKKLFAFFLLLPSLARADGTFFTTVFYDDGGIVYVGLKREAEGKKETQVITFPFGGGERTRIPLPAEIENRDVIGLIPEKKKVFVLTHGSESEKDGPMLHIFDTENGQWKKQGQLACPSFTKVKMTSRAMTFFCEQTTPPTRRNKKGGRSVVAKSISYGKDRLYRNGTWRFPEFMLRYKGVSLHLEGDAPNWNKLRLKPLEGDERVLKAEEVFQLPTPVELPISPTEPKS